MAKRIFISYRRSDTVGHAFHVYRMLSAHFGEDAVFLDKAIPPGADYAVALRDAVSRCDAVVALIGPGWVEVLGSDGQRRIQADDDWVREEIRTGLRRGVPVVPVLLSGASMPREDALPDDLKQLRRRQALPVPNDFFDEGVGRLVRALEDALGRGTEGDAAATSRRLAQARLAKADGDLAEAHRLLELALKADPTDTEALLLDAEVLIELTPDDPSDEARLLRRAKALLSEPHTDEERFRLAKATLFAATLGEGLDADAVSDARLLFSRLGRGSWVRQCDALLARARPPEPRPAPKQAPTPAPWTPPPAVDFQPVGRWQIQDTAMFSTTANVELSPGGQMAGYQQTPAMGLAGPTQGTWAWDPSRRFLALQGVFNGTLPFAFGVMVQGRGPEGWVGAGTDGNGYVLRPLPEG